MLKSGPRAQIRKKAASNALIGNTIAARPDWESWSDDDLRYMSGSFSGASSNNDMFAIGAFVRDAINGIAGGPVTSNPTYYDQTEWTPLPEANAPPENSPPGAVGAFLEPDAPAEPLYPDLSLPPPPPGKVRRLCEECGMNPATNRITFNTGQEGVFCQSCADKIMSVAPAENLATDAAEVVADAAGAVADIIVPPIPAPGIPPDRRRKQAALWVEAPIPAPPQPPISRPARQDDRKIAMARLQAEIDAFKSDQATAFQMSEIERARATAMMNAPPIQWQNPAPVMGMAPPIEWSNPITAAAQAVVGAVGSVVDSVVPETPQQRMQRIMAYPGWKPVKGVKSDQIAAARAIQDKWYADNPAGRDADGRRSAKKKTRSLANYANNVDKMDFLGTGNKL